MKLFVFLVASLLALLSDRGVSQTLRLNINVDTLFYQYETCTISKILKITVTNDGTSIDSVYLAGRVQGWSWIDIPASHPIALEPGESETYTLRAKNLTFPTQVVDHVFFKGNFGNSDTAWIALRRDGPVLRSTFLPSSPVFVNDTAHASFTLYNDGTRAFAPKLIDVVSSTCSYISFSGFDKDDVIPAGDSVILAVDYSLNKRGWGDFTIKISDDCIETQLKQGSTFQPYAAYWLGAPDITIRGCDSNTIHPVQIANYASTSSVIDSVVSLTSGWSVQTGFDGKTLMALDTADLKLLRLEHTMEEPFIVLYPHDNAPDTLNFRVTLEAPLPYVLPELDTVYLDVAIGESRSAALLLKNGGFTAYSISSVEAVSEFPWTLVQTDPLDNIRHGFSRQVILQYAGSDVEGDYPVTVSMQTSPCDEELAKTVIARVREASSVAMTKDRQLRVWPLPANDRLSVESSTTFSFELVDVLGASLVRGVSNAGMTFIDLSGLAAGNYILRTHSGNEISSRSIPIVR
jgi:hypothetical protein